MKSRIGAFILLTLVAACSTSGFVVNVLYNRVDNILIGNFEELANFDDPQLKFIEDRVKAWHEWHRRTQLPRYAALLEEVATRVSTNESVSHAEVVTWFDTGYSFYTAIDSCNPLRGTRYLFETLTEQQRLQLIDGLREQIEDERAEEKEFEEDLDDTITMFERVGFTIDETSAAMFAERVKERRVFQEKRYRAILVWITDLELLLHAPQSPATLNKLEQHVAGALSISRRAFPDEFANSVARWTSLIHDVLSRHDSEQRARLSARLNELAAALTVTANDVDEFPDNGNVQDCTRSVQIAQ